jgi:hypothetical protein
MEHTLNVFHDHQFDEHNGNWGFSALVKEEGRRTPNFSSLSFASGAFENPRENDMPHETHVQLYIWVYII